MALDFVRTVEKVDDVEGVEVFTAPAEDFSADSVYSSRMEKDERDSLFANLQKEIQGGNVKKQLRIVEVPVKTDGTLVKVYRRGYWQCIAVNETGALALPNINGDEEALWSGVSKYADAAQFQSVYVTLRNASAGPEVAIKKAQKFISKLSPEQLAAVKAFVDAAGK